MKYSRECDTDMKKVDEILKSKTKDQLDKEWEEFKKKFKKEHNIN